MLSNLENKKLILGIGDDVSKFWVFSLTNELELIHQSSRYDLFFTSKFNFYLVIFNTKNLEFIISSIKEITLKNYVHFVLSDFDEVKKFIEHFEKINDSNFDYSLLNYYSEILYDNEPINYTELNKFKYFFTSTNPLKKINDQPQTSDLILKLDDRYVLDYKYSLIYFYFKLGFCYFQKGDHLFDNSIRQNKLFMYTKSKDHNREVQIELARDTGKLYEKKFDKNDWYWYYHNYNNYHIPFIIDYNICKFNIIIETNHVMYNREDHPHFLSEKTLKSLIVPTPSYVLLQDKVYKDLVDYGFYFINKEFEGDGLYNYKNFCEYIKNINDTQLEEFYNKIKNHSYKNKKLLESYIFSDKIREINLLIGV